MAAFGFSFRDAGHADPDGSGLAGLAIGVAAVALGLAGGFVGDHAGDAVLFGGFASVRVGAGQRSLFGNARFFGKTKAFFFFGLRALAIGAACVAGFCDRLALGQLFRQHRLGGFARGAETVKLRLAGGGGAIAAIVQVGILVVSQAWFRFDRFVSVVRQGYAPGAENQFTWRGARA